MEPVFILSVFIAGIVMFLAPCTLPLLPAYIGFISGVTEREVSDPETRFHARRLILKNSLMFVLGFSSVFITFGLLAGLAGSFVGPLKQFLGIFAGIIIILFGLFMVGIVKLPALNSHRCIAVPKWLTVGTPVSSFILGGAFAFGWTPCIGPILATVLLFAGATETALTGAFLLVVFAAGFSVPFLLFALLISQATRFMEILTPFLKPVSVIGGVLLIFLGLFLLVGDFSFMTSWGYRALEGLDYEEALMRYL